jgi:hypothetical protein
MVEQRRTLLEEHATEAVQLSPRAADKDIGQFPYVIEDLDVHPMQGTKPLNNLEDIQHTGYHSAPEMAINAQEEDEMITIRADWNQLRVPSSTLKEKNVRTRSKSKNLHLQLN